LSVDARLLLCRIRAAAGQLVLEGLALRLIERDPRSAFLHSMRVTAVRCG